MIADRYTDTRQVRFTLPDDLPAHRTPKGNRPLRPDWLEIQYSITWPDRRMRIYVTLGGSKLENDARYGVSTVGQHQNRTFGTPWSRERQTDATATFDELGLPEWARPYVEDNRPSWCPAEVSA